MEYNFSHIEQKWRQYWVDNEVYKVDNDTTKPKFYILDMFPYPSGAGLHVGHPLGYIASDIYARYKRQKGFNVLHPMGFDSFGLPAEQYAVETGQHPAITTEKNITTYKKQLGNLGFNYDWNRQVSTCDSKYYKWTQWIFLQLFKSWYNLANNKAESIHSLIQTFENTGTNGLQAAAADETKQFTAADWQGMNPAEQQQVLMDYRLAYQASSLVNWCDALGTVLANDEVVNGVSERGGYPVTKKEMTQWFLRITAYSERLLKGLDDLNWSNSMKEMQRNWIGKSEGAKAVFKLQDSHESIEIFTTRPDTIFGATFMVLAPEHALVKQITTAEQAAAVGQYTTYVASKSDIERQAEKKVTGAFTGAYAINPLTNKKVPIWISEYVLIGYGTGAIMAVPSDDDRDYAFATKFGLEIIEVIDKSKYPDATKADKLGIMINSDFVDGMEVPDAIEAICQKLTEMGIGEKKINYKQRDAGYSRQRYWGEPFPIVYKNGIPMALPESALPITLPEIDNYKPTGTTEGPLSKNKEWVNMPDGSQRETDTMPGYAGSSWYFLRYMDPNNEKDFVGEESVSYWQDVDFYIGGTEHAVGHLLYSRFWYKFLFDRGFIKTKTDEPFKRLVNQGMIQGRSNFVYRIKGTNTFVSHGLKNDYEVDQLHVDVNIVRNDVLDQEAFKKWRPDYENADFVLENEDYVCGWEVEKMSKSKYNVVNPDVMNAQYGTDCFRMFEMFLGPIEQSKPWDTQGISGVSKFIDRLWRLFGFNENGVPTISNEKPTAAELKALHKCIKKVNTDIERLSFNTCISSFMVCVSELLTLKCNKKEVLTTLTQLIAPFAPFLTEELWHCLGNTGSVHHSKYPTHNEAYIKESTKTYPVQINGKVRAKIELPTDASKALVEETVLTDEGLAKWLGDKTVRKFIYVPGRIINIVVG